jgi:hypothetical protein
VVLDAERFSAATRLPPSPIQLAATDVSGQKPQWDDRLGQATLHYYLKRFMEPEQAHGAAAGWRGDRLLVYSEGSSPRGSALWCIHATTPEAAKTLQQALRSALLQQHGLPEDTPLPHTSPEGRTINLTLEAETLYLVDAGSIEMAAKLAVAR